MEEAAVSRFVRLRIRQRLARVASGLNPLMMSLYMSRSSKYWLGVLAWMSVVFLLSTDFGSATHTSRILRPFFHWLLPALSDTSVDYLQFLVRKAAHLSEYAVLAVLALGAVKASLKVRVHAWSWLAAGTALAVVAVYASLDEFHQLFVPTRTASFFDVLIDTGGGAIGLAIALACNKIRAVVVARRTTLPSAGGTSENPVVS